MIININKPKGYTSRDVVNVVGKHLKTKKVGHTGTLDPIATGVLVVCVGESTKLVELITSTDKEYIAQIKLGIKTDTGDITGSTLNMEAFDFSEQELLEVLKSFKGSYEQSVPIYSAVKVNGKKLYEYAREGKEVELPKRLVTIKKIELMDFKEDIIQFRVLVSKGTYIRSLIEDICNKLNTVGTMQSLIRTKQGEYYLDNSCELVDIENGKFNFMTIKDALKDLEMIEVPSDLEKLINNGAIIPKIFKEDKVVFLKDNEPISIYQTYHQDETKAKPYKMFN